MAATGPQTKAAPIAGTRDRNAIDTAHNSGGVDLQEPKDQTAERSLQQGHEQITLYRGADNDCELTEESAFLLSAQRSSNLISVG